MDDIPFPAFAQKKVMSLMMSCSSSLSGPRIITEGLLSWAEGAGFVVCNLPEPIRGLKNFQCRTNVQCSFRKTSSSRDKLLLLIHGGGMFTL